MVREARAWPRAEPCHTMQASVWFCVAFNPKTHEKLFTLSKVMGTHWIPTTFLGCLYFLIGISQCFITTFLTQRSVGINLKSTETAFGSLQWIPDQGQGVNCQWQACSSVALGVPLLGLLGWLEIFIKVAWHVNPVISCVVSGGIAPEF